MTEIGWEYGIAYPQVMKSGEQVWEDDGLDPIGELDTVKQEFETNRNDYLEDDRIVRRRKAGPWEPVEETP